MRWLDRLARKPEPVDVAASEAVRRAAEPLEPAS